MSDPKRTQRDPQAVIDNMKITRRYYRIRERLEALIECYKYPQLPHELGRLIEEAEGELYAEIDGQLAYAYSEGRIDERDESSSTTERLSLTVADVLRIVDANESRQDIERALIANLPSNGGVTPSDDARELTVHYARLGTHVENFALSLGWKREDGEGAFEFVQRKSYRQGWEDGKQEGSGDIHRDGVAEDAMPFGYALAARVMQSDLYLLLDATERAEVDELMRRGYEHDKSQQSARGVEGLGDDR